MEQLKSASIVKEDATKASQFSKHFVMNDGTEREIHAPKPIHYFDKKTNKWEEIDNSFEETEDGYIAKFGNYKVKLSKEEQSERVEVFSYDMTKSISWRYIGTEVPKHPTAQSKHRKGIYAEKDKLGMLGIGKCGKLVYEGVNGDVDIEYDIANGSLKENIIVNQKKKDYKYYFELKLKGFDMRLSENGKSIEFVDCNLESYDKSELKPEFIMPEPIMFDARGASSEELCYEIEKKGENYIFSISASSDWINSKQRVFPITIDPQISYNETTNDSIKTYEFNTINHLNIYGENECGEYYYEHYETKNPPVASVGYTEGYTEYLEISITPPELISDASYKRRVIAASLIFDVSGSSAGQCISIDNNQMELSGGTETVSYDILSKIINSTNTFSFYINTVDSYASLKISNIHIQLTYSNINMKKRKIKSFDLIGRIKSDVELISGGSNIIINDIEDQAMGVSLAHIHKSSEENYNCGENFRLNINDSLEKSGDSYLYTDTIGNVHSFTEHYYYVNESGEKELIQDERSLSVDSEGIIWYNGKEAYRELYTENGLKALTKLENLDGTEWLEQRTDEEKQLEDHIIALEDVIKSYVCVSEETHAVQEEKRITSSAMAESFIESDYALVFPESDAITLRSLYENLDYLDLQNQKTTLEIESLESDIKRINKDTLELTEKINELRNELDAEEDETKKESLQKTLDEYNDTLEYLNESKTNSETQLSINEINIQELVKQKESTSIQIKYYESLVNKNKTDLKKYYKEYLNTKNQLERIKITIPVCYLVSSDSLRGYNSNGELIFIRKNSGYCVYLEREKYTSSGKTRIISIKDDKGQKISFEYNPLELLSSITDSYGRRTSYEYSDGLLTKVNFYDGKIASIAYDSSKYIVSVKDEVENIRVKFNYLDEEHTIVSITKNNLNDQVSHNLVNESLSAYELDKITFNNFSDGVNVTYSNGTEEIYVFDVENARVCEYYQSVNGKITKAEKYEYKNDYLKSCICYADINTLNKVSYSDFEFIIGYKEELEYNSFELVIKRTVGWKKLHVDNEENLVECQTVTNYVYNSDNKLIETQTIVNERINNVSEQKYVTISNVFYDNSGNTVREDSYISGEELISGVTTTEYIYNPTGQCIKLLTYNSLDPSTKFYVEKQYDENGILLAAVDETGRAKTVYEYDSTGNLLSEILPNGTRYSYGRAKSGEVYSITHSTDFGESNSSERTFTGGLLTEIKSGNNVTRYSYNLKRKISKIDLNDCEDYVRYAYSELDDTDITEAILVNGVIITENKDKQGNVICVEIKDNENKKTVTYTYNNKNQITKVEDSISGNTSYSYNDETGVVTKIESLAQDLAETYTYNADGILSEKSVKNAGKNRMYSYAYKDTASKPIDSISVDDITIRPQLDVNGRNIGKTIEVSGTKIAEEQIAYLKFGDRATTLPQSIKYGNNINGRYLVRDNIKYKYDIMGNITEVIENGITVAKYEYDALGRLSAEYNKVWGKTVLYHYDDNGNIISKHEYEDGNASKEVTKMYAYDNDSDRLLAYGDDLFEYDGIGNPTVYRGKNVKWSNGREMTEFDGNTFTYDARGRRVSKNGITFTYDSTGKLIKQSNGLEFIYDHTGLLAVEYNSSRYFYRKNVQNDIIALLDNKGNIVVKYMYDAWGNQKIVDCNGNEVIGTNHIGKLNPFRYRSYYYDIETNLYFLKTRYYDPEICRFITIDDISYLAPDTINGLNLYAYCGNNPVNKHDPTGKFPWLLAAAAVLFTPIGGILTQAAVSVVSYVGMAAVAVGDLVFNDGNGAWADMCSIKWNPLNSDESKVLSSNNVSFYKGVPVFRTAAGGRSGSFGAIFLTKGSNKDDLFHERGHNSQLMMMGVGTYGFTVGIPSPLKLGKWHKAGLYYYAPWETMADILGGVTQRYGKPIPQQQIENAWTYYAISMLCFPITTFYWI